MASVLIIDDDDAVRGLLRAALERAGHRVAEGRDGAEGMSLYRRAPADLVITDVFMPGQDGIETIQQLREEFPQSRILAISGGTMTGATGPLTDAKLLGADATLAKPFTIDRLADAVRELLGG
ncbi:MAG TPA: response regulator [Longimicrobiales bacterium]